ncbi:MAG: two-component system NtrC family sensor kinase [Planctomycetota bacterium]|jgi:two-component system NtrC family sensor kinase
MPLRTKIVALLLVVVVSYGLTDFFVQRAVIAPIFEEVQTTEALEDIERVRHAIRAETAELTRDCQGLASWKPTWDFAGDRNQSYIEDNLGPSAFDRYGLDLIFISNPRGELLFGGTREEGWQEQIDLPRILSDAVVLTQAWEFEVESEPSNQNYTPTVALSGMRATHLGPVLLCTRPITDPKGVSEVRGAVTVGRLIDQEMIEALGNKTQVTFDLWPLEDASIPTAAREVMDQVTARYKPLVVEADAETLHVYSCEDDMASEPAFLLRARVARSVSASGETALRFAWNSTVVAGLIMLMALVFVLKKVVLDPLSLLTRHVVAIGKTEDVHAKLALDRDDELGILSRNFDELMGKLAQSRADLVTAAREAGMSEIATGILHNVGNTLNSVNVSAALLANKVRGMSGPKDLNAVVGVLSEHAEDLPEFIGSEQGSNLSPFLTSIAGSLDEDVSHLVHEVDSLTGGIEHIRELIQSQQNLAGRSALVESLFVHELIDEANLISERALLPDSELTIVHEIQDLPRLMLDRHKILEILVNLIQNARQAMLQAEIHERHLTIRAQRTGAEEDRLVIEVTDNGIGIDVETAEQIFNMGFTTKSSGHGFGLHAAANSAVEMGGSLNLSSEGLSTGATFRLELPFQEAPVAESQR